MSAHASPGALTARDHDRAARLWEIELPLTVPFAISGGVMHVRRSLLVELVSVDGATGFGESAPFDLPFYSSETVASARWMLANVLLPRLISSQLSSPKDADALLNAGVRGNPFARAGAETAVWDLFCHRRGVPLVDLLVTARARVSVEAPARPTSRRHRARQSRDGSPYTVAVDSSGLSMVSSRDGPNSTQLDLANRAARSAITGSAPRFPCGGANASYTRARAAPYDRSIARLLFI